MIVKNFQPSRVAPYRIAFVGEAPGAEEDACGRPFQGSAGKFLFVLTKEAGIDLNACFVGNVCQVRPPGNKINEFLWNGPEIQQGLQQLRSDIIEFQPNLVVLLGASPLRAARGLVISKGKQKPPSITNWRGSVFKCEMIDSPFYGFKCIATYHPAYLFRVYKDTAYVRYDLKRARAEGSSPLYVEPPLALDVEPRIDTICRRLDLILQRRIPISIDIEGYVGDMKCLGVSPRPGEAFIIPFTNWEGESYWTETDENILWEHLAPVLASPDVPKILQTNLYDRFVFAYSYQTLVSGLQDDTEIKNWELYCELAKGLDTLTSIHTKHAYYKFERKTGNQEIFWRYCCKDAAITNEINDVQGQLLEGPSRGHYNFNIRIQNPFLYIQLRGMLLDARKKAQRIAQLQFQVDENQAKLDSYIGKSVNVRSHVQAKWLLYDYLNLPVKKKKNAHGEMAPTSDYAALLTLAFESGFNNPILKLMIDLRSDLKHISDLEALTTDEDGRVRTWMNTVGTVTGRTSSSESATGSGTNMQTIREGDKDLLLADPEHDFGSFDLEGADGWTVAAHCYKHGDSTMLDDYTAKLKPAKVLALMVLHGEHVNDFDRPSLKKLAKDINAETDPQNGYIYFACKRIQHGSNYGMGPDKLALQIFLDSEGKIVISTQRAAYIQRLYFMRYKGVRRWQGWVKEQVLQRGYLVSASGNKRLFFDRKDASTTINSAYSQEPQHNTTWVTNQALLRLWEDPMNRVGRRLIVWPCHQVHDALNSQWHLSMRSFALEKMFEWFNNPIVVAGVQIVIPFDGAYGPSWGEKEFHV